MWAGVRNNGYCQTAQSIIKNQYVVIINKNRRASGPKGSTAGESDGVPRDGNDDKINPSSHGFGKWLSHRSSVEENKQ